MLAGMYSYFRSSTQDGLEVSIEQRVQTTNEMRIQGTVHLLCLVLFGIKRYLNVQLPIPIKLEKGGFTILNGQDQIPLYLFGTTNPESSSNRQVFLEQALILLDKNI